MIIANNHVYIYVGECICTQIQHSRWQFEQCENGVYLAADKSINFESVIMKEGVGNDGNQCDDLLCACNECAVIKISARLYTYVRKRKGEDERLSRSQAVRFPDTRFFSGAALSTAPFTRSLIHSIPISLQLFLRAASTSPIMRL